MVIKTLFIGLVVFVGATDSSSIKTEDYSWVLDEMNNEMALFAGLNLAENNIRIFDLDGNLVGQYSEEAFVTNELPVSDIRLILNSDFLFESGGESYYLKD